MAALFDPRANSINALRLGLAALVLVSHGIKLHGGQDPLGALTGGDLDLGTLAVDGFFALSGFLIVGSLQNSPSVGRYLWRRALRILPGFWVCLLVTAIVLLPLAQLLQFGTLSGIPLTGEKSIVGYVLGNAGLFITQFEVRGLMVDGIVNGSLYTLFYEAVCYLGVGALGVVGARRRALVVTVFAGAVWVVTLLDLLLDGGILANSTTASIMLRFGSMFLAGALLQLWSHRIVLNRWTGLAALVLLVVAVAAAAAQGEDPWSTLTYQLIAAPAVAVLLLQLGMSRALARIGARRDLSYGIYVYAWPLQSLLILAGGDSWPLWLYLVACVAVTATAALASWTWVESPALAFKSWSPRLRRRAAPRPGAG